MRRRTSDWAAKNRPRVKELQEKFRRGEKYAALVKKGAPSRAEYKRRRRATDVAFALNDRISAQINGFLHKGKGGLRTSELVGYSMDELKSHLERQFTKGMSWDNMGEWHIDHIVPLASFKITGPEDPELRRAWSLTNLRPLYADENRSKRDKRTHLI